MKRTTVLVYAAASLLCGFAGAMMWAQSDQLSLADVARQKSTAKARRVVTNDEIPPSPLANNPPASSSAVAGSSAPAGAKPGANPGAGKDGDKSAMPAEKLTKLQQLMAEHDSLEKIIKQMQEKIEASNDQNRIATLGEVVKHAKQALAENQQEIDKLKASDAASGDSGVTQPATNPPPTTEQSRPK